jgi:hypothetical protein
MPVVYRMASILKASILKASILKAATRMALCHSSSRPAVYRMALFPKA